MTNKERAVSFLKLAGSGSVEEAYEKYIAPNFIHHNQYFKGDRASLMHAMVDAHKSSPNKLIDIKRALEDGDTVVTHSHVMRQNPEQAGVAVVHIFRFENDKLVELWDLGQLLDKNSPNENGPF